MPQLGVTATNCCGAPQVAEVTDVFAAASTRLRRIVPFDAAVWVTTDPGTGLPTGPTRVEDLDGVSAAQCSENWRREFVDVDVNLFRDLARADVPAGALRVAARDPGRCARYRNFLRPLGFEDELRAVLRVGDSPWGAVSLLRRQAQTPFTRRETDVVAGLAEPLGEVLRTHAQAGSPRNDPLISEEPGLMIFDSAGDLVSINDQVARWLRELPADQCLPTDLGVAVPMWLMVTVFQAAADVSGNHPGAARARIRSRRGQWLVCHATCLRDADGAVDQVAVVIEPAQASEVAPIIIDAYGLTDREQQITTLIAAVRRPPTSPMSCTFPPTPSATTSRPSSARSRSPAAASWWPNCSPSTSSLSIGATPCASTPAPPDVAIAPGNPTIGGLVDGPDGLAALAARPRPLTVCRHL